MGDHGMGMAMALFMEAFVSIHIERENNAKLEMINTELTQATKTIRSIKSGRGY